jgi:hypothetical protein
MASDRITSMKLVRKALNKSDSEHIPLFVSLLDSGKNGPYQCKPVSNARLRFGPNETDFPGLGKKLSPFRENKLSSPEHLQGLLIEDLQTVRKEYSNHLLHNARVDAVADSQTHNKDQDLELLHHMIDPDQNASGTVLSFPSSSLEDICGDDKVEYDSILRDSMTTATILQRSILLSLQHSNEGTTFTTLLSGAVVWIIWPPTEHNIDILYSSYETFA